MRVLLIITALIILSAGCTERQELTGPWEMWVLVCTPSAGDEWKCGEDREYTVEWAAVPGESVRGELYHNGEKVMDLFDWQNRNSGNCTFGCDLAAAGSGTGFQVVVIDDQGFFGVSEVFSIR